MRRFGWQIGGLSIAIGALVVLGILVVAHGPTAAVSARHGGLPTASARATATPDPRVAAVEAAARRYVEAVEASARTGDPAAVDALVIPGSQAEGNAGITADFSRENHFNFISTRIDFDESSWSVSVSDSSATATFRYTVFGHSASWPSLQARETDHESSGVTMNLDFELRSGAWLVTRSS